MANKLFVGNIDWGTTDDELRELFSQYGAVEEAIIIKDRMSGRSKGFGFVTFESEDDAKKAIAGLNDFEHKGRKIVVSEARPQERD